MAGLGQLIYLLGLQRDVRRRDMEARERRWWAQEPIIDPYREADRLPAFAASLFMQVQEARDGGDLDRLARLVSDDVLREIEICGAVRAGWTTRVEVDDEPKVSYAGTGAVANRRDGSVFLIDAKLYEYEKDSEGRERPRRGGSTELHEYWTLAAERVDGPWKVIAIAPEPADYGDRRILEAVAVSMFKSVQAACNRGDLIELKHLLTDDVRRAAGWLRVDAGGVTSPDEITGEPRARCTGTTGGDPREGVTFLIDARLREREQKEAGAQIEQRTRDLRERWTLALGSEKDWVVTSIVDASQRRNAN